MKKDKFLLRVFISIIGLIILGIGVSLTIKSNLGSDPASTLQLGLSNVTGLSYGTASLFYNFAILIVVYFVDKKYIHISSILAMFIVGYTVDIILFLTSGIVIGEWNIIIRMIILILGTFICSFGVVIYIFSDLGMGATDCVAEVISEKLNKPFRLVRIISDVLFVIVGYFLGGPVGVGTVILAFIIGPFIQLSRKILHYLLRNEHLDDNLTEEDFEKDVII